MKPFYQTALQMLGATKNPHLYNGDFELQKLTKTIKKEADFETTNVAIYFGKKGVKVSDPYFKGKGPDK